MRKTVIFAGEAGQGIDRTAVLFGKMLAACGKHCFIYRDYSSLIRGGHNFSTVTFSDMPVRSHDEEADIIVALNVKAYEKHESQLKRKGEVVSSQPIGKFTPVIVPFEKGNSSNNALLGFLAARVGIPFSAGSRVLRKDFGAKAENIIKIFKEGYSSFGGDPEKMTIGEPKAVFDGNEAVAKGAIDAGLHAAFYYPMTPATGVFTKLESVKTENNIIVEQTEDEIAAANATIGASYAGKTVMTGSSGGGLALMSEAVSFAGMAELPVVFYAAQRMGPSTGVPTYTSQGDIRFVLNIGPGEFPRMVLIPGDIQEAYEMTRQAFYFSRKYRMPVFILSDKHIAESYASVGQKLSSTVSKNDFLKKVSGKNYKSYEITKDGISVGAVPGGIGCVRATSYEHDEFGYTTEDPEKVKSMNEKRMRKETTLKAELGRKGGISIYGKGNKAFVFSGSPKGAVLDALANLKGWSAIQINRLAPFPEKEFTDAIKGKEFLTVENNSTALLAGVIRQACAIKESGSILRYDGRPFTPDYIVEKIKKDRR
jgi:2-oxoglutarate ferredoxin oxidoreductase subunit alpha